MKLNEETIQNLIEYIPHAPELSSVSQEERKRMQILTRTVLTNYRNRFGDDAEFEYSFRKRFASTEIKLIIPGQIYDPMLHGSETSADGSYRLISNMLIDRVSTVLFAYGLGKNVSIVRAPRDTERKFLTNPMIQAVVLGILCGLLCRLLPQTLFDFLINDLVTPFSNVLLGVLSGIMGPVLFLSLVCSITTFNSISELNTIGKKIIQRFLLMTLAVALFSIGVCILIFRNLGDASASFAPGELIKMLLDIVPTNLFSPFVENNIPQIIVLGFGLGAAMLMIVDRGTALKNLLNDTSVWLNSFRSIIVRLSPLVPFLNLLQLTANNELDSILKGWKYLVGVLACLVVYGIWKLCFVSLKHSLNPLLLLKKIKPLLVMTFAAGSGSTAIDTHKQIAKEELGISPSFTEFWIPMSYALLSPASTINYIVPAFCVAQLSGTPVSASFLVVLILLSVQMSLASPGLVSTWVIIFTQLGMPVSYVGVFSASKVVLKNFTAAFRSLVETLEHLDAAFAMDAVDENILRDKVS